MSFQHASQVQTSIKIKMDDVLVLREHLLNKLAYYSIVNFFIQNMFNAFSIFFFFTPLIFCTKHVPGFTNKQNFMQSTEGRLDLCQS